MKIFVKVEWRATFTNLKMACLRLPTPKLTIRIKVPKEQPTFIPKGYHAVSQLNSGTFGIVTLAIAKSRYVAVKRIHILHASDMQDTTPLCLNKIKQEAKLWKRLDHPNINPLIDLQITTNAAFLISEVAEGSDLFEVLSNDFEFTRHPSFLPTMYAHVSAALKYMHDERNMYHGDIKPENIVLRCTPTDEVADMLVDRNSLPCTDALDIIYPEKTSKPYKITFQLIDFGSSRCIDADDVTRFRGTMNYVAPEFLDLPYFPHVSSDRRDDRFDPRAQDIWTFGLTIWDCLRPSVVPVFEHEIFEVLPFEYCQSYKNDYIDRKSIHLWRYDKNLLNRFQSLLLQGQELGEPLCTLLGGMTTFDVTQRFKIDDVLRYVPI